MENIEKIENNNNIENKAFFNSNLNNKKILNKKNSEEGKDTQFYLITLEDNNGEHQQIRIFKNSDPSEIAFNFCKENNLDFKSMKYIKKNIQKIIEQFDEPNHKLFFLDNSYSSIQEVDEENLASENTIKSKNSVAINENNVNKEKNNNSINCVIIEKSENDSNINNNDKNINDIKDNKNQENEGKLNLENSIENNKNKTNENIENKNNVDSDVNKNNINDKIKNDENKIITKNNQNNNSEEKINQNENNISNTEKNDKNKNNNNIINNNKDENLKINKDSLNNIENNQDNNKNNKNSDVNINDKTNKNINNNNNVVNSHENKNISNEIKKHPSFKIEKLNIIEEKLKRTNEAQSQRIVNNINNNINDKKLEKKNSKNNFIKVNTQINKELISNIIHKNIAFDNSLNSNNHSHNLNIKFQNKIPKLFKYINPKQHLINEEYKILKKKELNRENILDKYFKIISKNQKEKLEEKSKSKSKEKYKTIDKEKEKDKSKTNKTFITVSKSNLNIKKEKKINNNIETDTNINTKKKNKNNTTLASIRSVQKNNKSLSNYNSNFNFQESDNKKNNKDKANIEKESCTPSNLFLKIREKSNSNISLYQRKDSYNKIRKKLRTRKEIFDNIMSNTFVNNNSKTNLNQFNTHINTQIFDRGMGQNKSSKNKVIIKRNTKNLFDNKDNSKVSSEMNKQNEMNQNIFNEKIIKKCDGDSQSKSKRISEMRNGLNGIFNNFIGPKNNILNTNYIINKRCRIINNKNKKNMSMNLSRYILDFNRKKNKSPKFNLEINVSNNNFDNLTLKDNQSNTNFKQIIGKNNNISTSNFYYKDSNRNNNPNNIMASNKKNHYILFSTQNQSILRRYNTNINNNSNSSRILSSFGSYSKTKKKIVGRKKEKFNSKINNISIRRKKKIASKNKDISNNLNNSNSLLLNNDRTNQINDYCLKILDQYYTINNTINITNNNSLLNSFSNNNNLSSKRNYYDEKVNNNINYLIKNLFESFDKDNNGFIIISYKQKINEILNTNKIVMNKDAKKILAKMVKILFDINKKNCIFEFDEDKIIINKNFFIKHMMYIYANKLNTNEKKILLSIKKEIDKSIKKDFMSYAYTFKPKSSFNRYKDNKFYLSSSKLNNTKENKSISSDINRYIKKKIKKNISCQKAKFNSFNDL